MPASSHDTPFESSSSLAPPAKRARLSAEPDPYTEFDSENSADEDAHEECRVRLGMRYNELYDQLAHLAAYFKKRMKSKAVGSKEREQYAGTHQYYSSLVQDLDARFRDGTLMRTELMPDDEVEKIEAKVPHLYKPASRVTTQSAHTPGFAGQLASSSALPGLSQPGPSQNAPAHATSLPRRIVPASSPGKHTL